MSRVGDNVRKARLAAGLTEKELARKLGVSESYIVEVESGRKVINEATINKITKVVGKSSMELGMNSFETQVSGVPRMTEKRRPLPQKDTVRKPVKSESQVWDTAFGENLKNVPVYDVDMKEHKSQVLYPVEQGKIRGIPADRAVIVRNPDEELMGYLIGKDALLLGATVKEILKDGFYLIRVSGEDIIRKIKLLGNGNCLVLANKDREVSITYSLKEIRPSVRFISSEISL